eukprot:RCo042566
MMPPSHGGVPHPSLKAAMVLLALMVGAALAAMPTPSLSLRGYTPDDYIREFDREYSAEEERSRRALITERLEEIWRHNRDPTKSWKMGVNQFTDRFPEELSALRGLDRSHVFRPRPSSPPPLSTGSVQRPERWDWRDKGVVSPPKEQGQCGSCWAMAATATVESVLAVQTGKLLELSVQQVVDCTNNTRRCGNTGVGEGCAGATAELAYEFLIARGGHASEWSYPYTSFGINPAVKCYTEADCKAACSTECNPCPGPYADPKLNKTWLCGPAPTPSGLSAKACRNLIVPVANVTGYVQLPANELDPVMKALLEVGPLAVVVDASTWVPYASGVFDGCNQTNPVLNHVVQLVGYGNDSVYGDYWLIRNSWGPLWGEKGYIRIRRTTDEQGRCGTDSDPQQGTGCDGGPSSVKVCGTCGMLYDASYPFVSPLARKHPPILRGETEPRGTRNVPAIITEQV